MISIPTVVDVDRITTVSDPVIRNLQITQCYHELSAALPGRTGLSANWCTFATWASKQAGQTIRKEDLARLLEEALKKAFGEAALDTMIIARFDAPGQETATWLVEIGLSAPPQAGFSPFFSIDPPLSAAKDWWAPPIAGTTAGDFRGISQQVGQKHFNVVVIGSESDQVTVYLQVYNT